MNCKPGDTAFVVRNTYHLACFDFFIGTPVVVETAINAEYGPAWSVKNAPLCCPGCGSHVLGFLDVDLQPIRGEKPAEGTATERQTEQRDEVTA